MKIVQINTTCGNGSTGKICSSISNILDKKKIDNYILFSLGKSNYEKAIKCSTEKYIRVQAIKSRILGNYGFNSYFSTKKIISNLNQINPDIVHIHNIHSHDCNIEMLCDYLKKKKIKVVWTFHDCWMFTAYCPYFSMIDCEKWKKGCHNCPLYKHFSWFFDRSSSLYEKKKEVFEGLDLTVVTPSEWLKKMVQQSFLKDIPTKVICNGIDLDVFKPISNDFRKTNHLDNKKVVLGVSFDWDERKGIDIFIELSKRLSDEYRIVLIGTNKEIDKKLPSKIISIHRTQNQHKLAEVYSAADVFVNPTREENYPTVNMEAIACGTPVITFNTGGSPEMIGVGCGIAVEKNDIDSLEKEIIRACEEQVYSKEACIDYAKGFDKNKRFKKYIELYRSIL